MKTNVPYLTKKQSGQLNNGLAKEVIAWVLVIGLFTTLLTYLYIWPYVVLSSLQIAALWITGGLLTLIPVVQQHLHALNLRYEQELLIRFAFIVPIFISVLLLFNYLVPVSSYQESHTITGTYEIIIYKKKSEISYVGLHLKNNAYQGIEKIRTIDPQYVPDKPTQITYTFNKGIIGIKSLQNYHLE